MILAWYQAEHLDRPSLGHVIARHFHIRGSARHSHGCLFASKSRSEGWRLQLLLALEATEPSYCLAFIAAPVPDSEHHVLYRVAGVVSITKCYGQSYIKMLEALLISMSVEDKIVNLMKEISKCHALEIAPKESVGRGRTTAEVGQQPV